MHPHPRVLGAESHDGAAALQAETATCLSCSDTKLPRLWPVHGTVITVNVNFLGYCSKPVRRSPGFGNSVFLEKGVDFPSLSVIRSSHPWTVLAGAASQRWILPYAELTPKFSQGLSRHRSYQLSLMTEEGMSPRDVFMFLSECTGSKYSFLISISSLHKLHFHQLLLLPSHIISLCFISHFCCPSSGNED